jgi:RNA polymerase sigma-70 factor (ECF subfamily)
MRLAVTEQGVGPMRRNRLLTQCLALDGASWTGHAANGTSSAETAQLSAVRPNASPDGAGAGVGSPHVHGYPSTEALLDVRDDLAPLVLAARDGDRSAYGRLVERHWSRLVRLARTVIGEGEAEDAVQEGLVAAWRKLEDLADPERFPAWVTRIVYRRCLRRTGRFRHLLPLADAPEPHHNPSPEGELLVWQVLQKLAPRQRAVLHLTVVEGMSDSEIGSMLAIAPASVRAHRRRARERVATILKGGRS